MLALTFLNINSRQYLQFPSQAPSPGRLPHRALETGTAERMRVTGRDGHIVKILDCVPNGWNLCRKAVSAASPLPAAMDAVCG